MSKGAGFDVPRQGLTYWLGKAEAEVQELG
jgi:hypothetical protein